MPEPGTNQSLETSAWHELPFGGVLELREQLTHPGPALELHLIRNNKRLVAFWMTDGAEFIGRAEVGQA